MSTIKKNTSFNIHFDEGIILRSEGLGKDSIGAFHQEVSHVLLERVPCDGEHLAAEAELSDQLGGERTNEHWHGEVHDYRGVLLQILLRRHHFLDGVTTINCIIAVETERVQSLDDHFAAK